MKKKIGLLVCVVLILTITSTVYAANNFNYFVMNFSSISTYQKVCQDTTSKDMVATNPNAYGRLTVTSTAPGTVNNVWRAGRSSTTSPCSKPVYAKTCTDKHVEYTVDASKGSTIYLQGRPDSSIPTCIVSGSWGAG